MISGICQVGNGMTIIGGLDHYRRSATSSHKQDIMEDIAFICNRSMSELVCFLEQMNNAFNTIDMDYIRDLSRRISLRPSFFYFRWWHRYTTLKGYPVVVIKKLIGIPARATRLFRMPDSRSGVKGRTIRKRLGKFYK